MKVRTRKYWIVKHGLDALTALPGCIWRTVTPQQPPAFKRVKRGDRWLGFAYTTSRNRERPLSMVTGFYECVAEAKYLPIPARGRALDPWIKKAWIIRGRPLPGQPIQPVGVPSIPELLKRRVYQQQTLIAISRAEFDDIRREVSRREFDPKKIPLLGREPRYEQEVLAVVACGHKRLGIDKILRLRTQFPDMTVKIRGKKDPVHLEVEVYGKSFFAHHHEKLIDKKGRYTDRTGAMPSRAPVGLLCWVNDEQRRRLNRHGIAHVYELQQMIRCGERIRW